MLYLHRYSVIHRSNGHKEKIVSSSRFNSETSKMRRSNSTKTLSHSQEIVTSISMDSRSNSTLQSTRRSLSGLRQASIFYSYSKSMMAMLHSGQDFSRIRTKISISTSIGPNGLMRMRRKKMDKRDLEESILPKCKVIIF